MIVVDASAIAEVLIGTTESEALALRLFGQVGTLHVPHLLDVEVVQVVRRFVLRGELASDRGRLAVANLADLPLQRHPHQPLMTRVWELRANFTAYDATYIALAEVLRAPLITRDKRLAVAPGHSARIELI